MLDKLKLEDELKKLDRELNGPKVPPEEPQGKPKPRTTEPPPWTPPLLLDE